MSEHLFLKANLIFILTVMLADCINTWFAEKLPSLLRRALGQRQACSHSNRVDRHWATPLSKAGVSAVFFFPLVNDEQLFR